MCGIIGVIGDDHAEKTLVDGLKKLEYRGYDSAGIAVIRKNRFKTIKATGHVSELAEKIDDKKSKIGIGHTRWATHGKVSEINSHPHISTDKKIIVVHNGIIDNYDLLKTSLIKDGKVFNTQTDSEVIPNLIEKYYTGDPVSAVKLALAELEGTYGIAVMFADNPDVMIAAKMGSPIILGLGDNKNYISSDTLALVRHTNRVIHLEDGEIAVVSKEKVDISDIFDDTLKESNVETIGDNEKDIALADLGFPNYMIKEIFEQPESIRRCLAGRLDKKNGNALLTGLNIERGELANLSRVCFAACGTSLHAAIIASRMIEEFCKVPSRAYSASDIIDTNPLIGKNEMWFAISQSGETFDTLQAIREVALKASSIKGIINVPGSTIARECGSGVYIHSGREISVASTKAFTSQLAALAMFSLKLARSKYLTQSQGRQFLKELCEIPDKIELVLRQQDPIKQAALKIKDAKNVMFIGRGMSEYVAKEGALKLKEISYIPCDAYSGAELKHGPIAMLSDGVPVIAVVPDDDSYERTLSNIHEAKARGSFIITVGSSKKEVKEISDINIPVPKALKFLSPFLTIIPMQLIAYYTTLELGYNVDKPRNLAKSVTVG